MSNGTRKMSHRPEMTKPFTGKSVHGAESLSKMHKTAKGHIATKKSPGVKAGRSVGQIGRP